MTRITRSISRASRNSCDNNVSIESPKQLEPDAISLASSNAENFLLDVGSQSSSPTTGPILPDSDQNYHRRIFIMPSIRKFFHFYNFNLKLRPILEWFIRCLILVQGMPLFTWYFFFVNIYPKMVIFQFDHKNAPLELMRLDQTRRSLFYGNSVIADPGQMLLVNSKLLINVL